jgi:hypothetical protein
VKYYKIVVPKPRTKSVPAIHQAFTFKNKMGRKKKTKKPKASSLSTELVLRLSRYLMYTCHHMAPSNNGQCSWPAWQNRGAEEGHRPGIARVSNLGF